MLKALGFALSASVVRAVREVGRGCGRGRCRGRHGCGRRRWNVAAALDRGGVVCIPHAGGVAVVINSAVPGGAGAAAPVAQVQGPCGVAKRRAAVVGHVEVCRKFTFRAEPSTHSCAHHLSIAKLLTGEAVPAHATEGADVRLRRTWRQFERLAQRQPFCCRGSCGCGCGDGGCCCSGGGCCSGLCGGGDGGRKFIHAAVDARVLAESCALDMRTGAFDAEAVCLNKVLAPWAFVAGPHRLPFLIARLVLERRRLCDAAKQLVNGAQASAVLLAHGAGVFPSHLSRVAGIALARKAARVRVSFRSQCDAKRAAGLFRLKLLHTGTVRFVQGAQALVCLLDFGAARVARVEVRRASGANGVAFRGAPTLPGALARLGLAHPRGKLDYPKAPRVARVLVRRTVCRAHRAVLGDARQARVGGCGNGGCGCHRRRRYGRFCDRSLCCRRGSIPPAVPGRVPVVELPVIVVIPELATLGGGFHQLAVVAGVVPLEGLARRASCEARCCTFFRRHGHHAAVRVKKQSAFRSDSVPDVTATFCLRGFKVADRCAGRGSCFLCRGCNRCNPVRVGNRL